MYAITLIWLSSLASADMLWWTSVSLRLVDFCACYRIGSSYIHIHYLIIIVSVLKQIQCFHTVNIVVSMQLLVPMRRSGISAYTMVSHIAQCICIVCMYVVLFCWFGRLKEWMYLYAIGVAAINDTDLKKAITSCYECIADCVVRLRTTNNGVGNIYPTFTLCRVQYIWYCVCMYVWQWIEEGLETAEKAMSDMIDYAISNNRADESLHSALYR